MSTGTDVTVRPYTPSDLTATVDIFLRAIREVSSKDYTQAQIDAWAKVEDFAAWGVRRSSRPTWIAQVDERPAGFADLTADGLLDMMFVHPEFQGMGIASRLLQTVETEAGKQGLSRIRTEASRTARPFFERRGFALVEAQQVKKRGQRMDNFLMEKLLGSTVR
jgi:putative acetyltransferase